MRIGPEKNLRVYMLHQFTMRTIKSRFDSSGRSIKYYMPAIVQGEGAVRNVSSFKKSTIESLIPGKKYKILNATSHPTFGIELKADSVIMDTSFELTEEEKKSEMIFLILQPTTWLTHRHWLTAHDCRLARSK